jgi:hypothetical protein
VEQMSIEKYTAYFHDGALIDIQHSDNQIVLSLESSEMDLSDLKDPIQLSERNSIKGKLHLKRISSVILNDVSFSGQLKMKYDSGTIFDLHIEKKRIEISLSWENFPPKPSVNDFDTIVIEAEEVKWENIPDLYDPFW